jgi:thiamine kinase-like enzyme
VWGLSDEALLSVAELLRNFHEAVATFDAEPYDWPRALPAGFVRGTVSHNDVNLDNVVFRDGRAVALIDFDLAAPGSRLWDVACAARQWAPLRPDSHIHDPRRGSAFERLRVFLDAYGAEDVDPSSFAAAVRQNQEWFGRLIERYVAAGHEGFSAYARSETRLSAEAYGRWLAENDAALRAALSGRAGGRR